jgi:hypothetical protein
MPDRRWLSNPDYRCLLQALRQETPPERMPFRDLFADPDLITFISGEYQDR